jgi:peptidoglycan-associated lipoprotein
MTMTLNSRANTVQATAIGRAGLLVACCLMAASCQRSTQRLPPMPPMPQSARPAGPAVFAASGTETPTASSPAERAFVAGTLDDFLRYAGTDRVVFEYDSHELSVAAKLVLDRQAEWLQLHAITKVVIEGHTDGEGTRAYNYALGDRRAVSIRNYLLSKGLDVARFSIISFGSDMPETESIDDASRLQSRRGVTVILQ